MEFFGGIVFAFLMILITKKLILSKAISDSSEPIKIIYRQSHIFDMVRPAIPYMPPSNIYQKTQARVFASKSQKRFIFSEDTAYWIGESGLYSASIVNGEIDHSTAKVVDTMAMDKVELDKMIFIVEKLTEGISNDGGSSGVSGL